MAYMLDGAMHNDPQNNLNLPLPFPDALQEFRVATSGLSAQNGMHSGASVNAVTKSGTNRFSGNAFEFLRDKRFNATNPFAPIGPDGKRKDDGLKRNQFGGTIGGPIVRDKLFFFGGYQGTAVRQTPADNIAFVPTRRDAGRRLHGLRLAGVQRRPAGHAAGAFVGNRIDPARFSPAAVNLASGCRATTDPCGEITYSAPRRQRRRTGRRPRRLSAERQSFDLRPLHGHASTRSRRPSAATEQRLTTATSGHRQPGAVAAVGDTKVFGTNMVNALRFAFNRTAVNRDNTRSSIPMRWASTSTATSRAQ